MIPLLPMPVTTTRPPQEWRHSTAHSKSRAIGPAMRWARSCRASASMRTTLDPVDFIGTIVANSAFSEIPTVGREPYQRPYCLVETRLVHLSLLLDAWRQVQPNWTPRNAFRRT